MNAVQLARIILSLPPRELARLNEILRSEGGESLGVREPRRPSPESPGDEMVVDLPEDYWETAQ